MKIRRNILMMLVVGLVLAGGQPTQARRIPIDGYAAVVNDRVITVGDVLTLIQPLERELRLSHEGKDLQEKLEEAYSEALDKLIENALILEDFEAQEAEIPPEMVDDQVRSIIEERFGNNRTEFLQTLEQQQLSVGAWREQVAERLAVMFLRRQEVYAQLTVSPTAVRLYYDDHLEEFTTPAQVRVRMIVLQKGVEAEQAIKREEADRLVAEIEAGADFATLARTSSEGGRASRGGEWDWIEPAKLRSELAEAIAQLEPGTHSDVVETQTEFYIIKLEGRKNRIRQSFDQAKDGIEKQLKNAEEERLQDEWIARLKDKHFVKVYDRL
jgi:parvulin-like peptidyl-prolyl isomerase